MATKTITLIKGIVFLGISLYLAFTFNDSLFNFIEKVPIFGWVSGSILMRIVLSIGFGRGVQLIYKSFKVDNKSNLVFFIGCLFGFTISFMVQPIYTSDYGNFGTTDKVLDLDKLNLEVEHRIELNSKETLIIFFSTNCETCIEVATKLGKLSAMGSTPKIVALFNDDEEGVKAFLNKTNSGTFEYNRIDNIAFFEKMADYSFPSLFLLDKNGQIIQHWEGGLMNYSALDFINTYK